jgi:F0F1-type ATP synthase delta subunit
VEQVKLPSTLFSKGDVMRLGRELNSLDDFFVGAAARAGGTPTQMPKTTRLLAQFAEVNQVNLLDAAARKSLQTHLKNLLEQAPNFHVSFASEPTPKTVEPILAWLRANIHPHILLQVGIQPSIAAGCMLRTPNRIIDMSIRSYMEKQSQYLASLVSGVVNGR